MKSWNLKFSLSVSASFAFLLSFAPSESIAQSYQVTFGNASKLSRAEQALLSTYDEKEDFTFLEKTFDLTSYSFIETNINLNFGGYDFQAFLSDGSKIDYPLQGERRKYSECKGEICFIITNRNILGISNYAEEWSKASFYNEEIFKTKTGNKAAFIVTERSLYLYNGYLNEWERIALEAEIVQGVANKNELALITTSRRIIGIHLPSNQRDEMSLLNKPIFRYLIKTDTIDFFSHDRFFQYRGRTNQITEIQLQ